MRKRTRVQAAGEIAVFLAGTVAGFSTLPALPSVLGLALLLLWISDQGQHRALGALAPDDRERAVALSVGMDYGLNVIAVAATYVFGAAMGWMMG